MNCLKFHSRRYSSPEFFFISYGLGNVHHALHHRRGHVHRVLVPALVTRRARLVLVRGAGTKSQSPIEESEVSIVERRDRGVEAEAIHHGRRGAIDGIEDIKTHRMGWNEWDFQAFRYQRQEIF